ncbi:MAG: hypothetical protein OYH76_24775 [Defluviicoccus sp.]|nr:hypothetical protein [Defluviicoccus sp.]MDE0279123.1 hypothetical protein [Defluviicoccus sp.]
MRRLAAAVAAAALLTLPAAAQDDCDPEVEQALIANAERGTMDDLVIVRHPEHGVRDPESILDFSCIERMFNYRTANILFDPGDIFDLLRREICSAARDAYGRYVGRSLDLSVFARDLPRLPGLRVLTQGGNILDEAQREGRGRPESQREVDDLPWLRQPSAAPRPEAPVPGVAPPRPSRRELFRDILGGSGG